MVDGKRLERLPYLLALLLAIHGLIWYRVHDRVDSFTNADRALIRLEKIDLVVNGAALPLDSEIVRHPKFRSYLDDLENEPPLRRLAYLGPPGDYLFHGLLLSIGGRMAVVAVQFGLMLIAVLLVFDLARRFAFERRVALGCAATYALLPLTIASVWQLSIEALLIPLLPICIWTLVRTWQGRGSGAVSASVAFASLVLVRPFFLLFGLAAVCGAIIWGDQARRRAMVIVALVGVVIVAFWTMFVVTITGSSSLLLGETAMDYNLSLQVRRFVSLAGGNERDVPELVNLGDFVHWVTMYPIAFLRYKIAENANLFLNIGINQFLGDLLRIELFDPRTSWGKSYWNHIRKTAGPIDILTLILRQDPLWIVIFVGSMVVWGMVLVTGIGGMIVEAVKGADRGLWITCVLVPFVLNVAAAQIPVTRPGQRAPVDVLLILSAAACWRRGREGALQPSCDRRAGARRAASP